MANDTRKCPHCGEEIRVDARVCRFCQRQLVFPREVKLSPITPPVKQKTSCLRRAVIIFVIVIVLSLLCVCFGQIFFIISGSSVNLHTLPTLGMRIK